MKNKKYTLQEIQDLVEKGEEYLELEKKGCLLHLPCSLGSLIYRVIPDCKNCATVADSENCREHLPSNCGKKVMPGVFTIDMLPEFGKTVFKTESEAVVASVSH